MAVLVIAEHNNSSLKPATLNAVAAACDMLVSIPMASGNESLNAGIAASIALYEIAGVRARKG